MSLTSELEKKMRDERGDSNKGLLIGHLLYSADRHWKSNSIVCKDRRGRRRKKKVWTRKTKGDVTGKELSKKESERQRRKVRERGQSAPERKMSETNQKNTSNLSIQVKKTVFKKTCIYPAKS